MAVICEDCGACFEVSFQRIVPDIHHEAETINPVTASKEEVQEFERGIGCIRGGNCAWRRFSITCQTRIVDPKLS